jgi:hypothetical protein
MNITVMVEGQPFFVTGSSGDVYTFLPSSSVTLNPIGYATASVDITAINEFDQFVISASKQCQIVVVNNKNLQDADPTFYIGWSGSNAMVEASASIQFDSGSITASDCFEVCDDSVSHSLIASSNPNITDIGTPNTKFFYVDDSSAYKTVASMSQAINSIDNFCVTASVSASVTASSATVLTSSITNFSTLQTVSSSFDSPVSKSFTTTTVNVTTSSLVSIVTSSFDYYSSSSFSQSFETVLSQSFSSSISGALMTEFTNSFEYFITQSFTQSYTSSYDTFLLLESVDSGELGNKMYFWNTDDFEISESYTDCAQTVLNDDDYATNAQNVIAGGSNGVWTEAEEADLLEGFTIRTRIDNKIFLQGGQGMGMKGKFELLTDKLSEISQSCGFNFNHEPYTLHFTASVKGIDGNSYFFQSGSTTASFGGASNSASLDALQDDTASRVYYYSTGSSLSETVTNLSGEINDSIAFVTASNVDVTMSFTSTTNTTENNNIGLQSGSFQIKLTGSEVSTLISSSVSQSFKNQTSDLKMDVSKIVDAWLSGTPNNGIILTHSEENTDVHFGALKYFSQNTNTIYIPRLAVKYDDSVISSSLNVLDLSTQNVVSTRNLKKEYRQSDEVRVDIIARERYPAKTFNNQFTRFVSTDRLPAGAHYAIQDASSQEFIVDFDENYTKLSADDNGSYFMLDMSGFPQERFFRIFIKVVQNGESEIFTDDKVFKVTI